MVEKRERRRRDGTTYAVWRVRWRDERGVERSRTFDRATDARAYEAKVRTLKRKGALDDIDAGTETLAEFVEEWWLVYAGPNLERSTLRAYASFWNSHALPRLGHLQLRELTPQTIARFRAELEDAGVGIEAIRKTMTMLQGVLQRAVEWGRIPTNAVKVTRKPPKPVRPAVLAIPPALIEIMRAQLLAEDRARDAALLVVLAYAGLRPQEALVLEWRHVRERTLLVERAVSDGQLKALKNRRQPRTVSLLTPLRDDLAVWRQRSAAAPSSPVFPAASGAFWRASDWRNWRKRVYKPLAESVGIDGARRAPPIRTLSWRCRSKSRSSTARLSWLVWLSATNESGTCTTGWRSSDRSRESARRPMTQTCRLKSASASRSACARYRTFGSEAPESSR
jgi:integrase